MAGILDSKERFMDFQLTKYGRRQLAQGNLNFSFAVVSDRGTFYAKDSDDMLTTTELNAQIEMEENGVHTHNL